MSARQGVRRVRSQAWGLIVSYALVACGSSPSTRYFTLSAIPPADPPGVGAHQPAVRVEPVAIPSELDRLELVSHVGPNIVRIAGVERWAAPLDEQLRRIVSEDLAARLPAGEVADPNEPATDEARRLLALDIGEFDVDQSCAVTLRADWTLRATGSMAPETLRGTESVSLPGANACAGRLAETMSQAVGILADRLASALRIPAPAPAPAQGEPRSP
jgi:uncharacterized lipoprotein YmbA